MSGKVFVPGSTEAKAAELFLTGMSEDQIQTTLSCSAETVELAKWKALAALNALQRKALKKTVESILNGLERTVTSVESQTAELQAVLNAVSNAVMKELAPNHE
jgi:hypothetical protein